jgi:hypothetical protein
MCIFFVRPQVMTHSSFDTTGYSESRECRQVSISRLPWTCLFLADVKISISTKFIAVTRRKEFSVPRRTSTFMHVVIAWNSPF